MVSYTQNQPKNGLIRHLSYSLIGNLRIFQREVTKVWQKLIKIHQLAIKTYFFQLIPSSLKSYLKYLYLIYHYNTLLKTSSYMSKNARSGMVVNKWQLKIATKMPLEISSTRSVYLQLPQIKIGPHLMTYPRPGLAKIPFGR